MRVSMMFSLFNERLMTVIGGTAVTVVLAIIAWNFGLTQNHRIFDFETNNIKESIFERIQVSDAIAKSLQALFHSSLFVDGDQFLIIVQELIRRYPYILSVSYCPRIRAQDRTAFEAEQELWGIVGFRIFEYAAERKVPAAPRPFYFPIMYREPLLAKDTMALGYDLFSSEALTPTITRAIADGVAIPSPLVTLAETPGYQVIIAVYEGKHVPAASDERVKSVNGLLCLTLSPEAFLTNIHVSPDITIRLDNLSAATGNEAATVLIRTPARVNKLRQLFSMNFVTEDSLRISAQHFRLTMSKRLDMYHLELWLVAVAIIIGIAGTWSVFVILRSRLSLRQELQIRQVAERHLQQVNAELDLVNAGLEQRVQERTAEIARQKYVLDTFMDTVPDRIYFKDRAGRITGANRAHAQHKGFNDSIQEIGKTDFDFFPEEVARHKFDQEQMIIQTGQPVLGYEEESTSAGGQTEWSLTTKMPLRDEHGEIIGTFGISRDITPLKQTQRALEEHTRELAAAYQQVAARTAELQALNEELNSFAHIVSHDLKAPLRNVTQLITWLIADYAAAFDANGKELTHLLLSRVKRMENLISGVLEYSRVGRKNDTIEMIDLSLLLPDVVDSLSPPPHIHITLSNALPTVVGDKIRLTQVFQNLIGNAIKFMDKPHGEITVGCADVGEFWQFSVTDNGPGIAPQYQEKIFQIFQTLQRHDDQESTGVGLTIVKKIVEWYGGEIWVESTVGEGSAFVWTFPKTV